MPLASQEPLETGMCPWGWAEWMSIHSHTGVHLGTLPEVLTVAAHHGLLDGGLQLTCLHSTQGGSCASRQPQTQPQCHPG